MKKKSVDWVVIRTGGTRGVCLRCGAERVIPLPMPLADFGKFCRAFVNEHKSCKPKDAA